MAFDNIKLEKGLYTTGKSFTDALEELDPSENYIGTALEGLDAYERQLKRFDIKVSGANSDPVSKFFATTDSSALFPEYIARAVRTGIEGNNVVEDIIATTTEIDGFDYRSIKTAMSDSDLDLSAISEGVQLPEIKISLNEKLTKLQKHGKMLTASYEAIKFQKLDLFTTVLKQIGNHISRSELSQAILSIEAQDSMFITAANNEITYENLLKLWINLEPYNLNRMIINKEMLSKLLEMPEFRDANAGLDFHATGRLITPFGCTIIISEEIDSSLIVGLDKNFAIEKVQAGGVITEFDKLIDRQLERATISTITGFSTIYDDAIKLLSFAEE